MKINKKIAAACSVAALAGAVFIGTTLAYLTDTAEVTNQFSVGKVEITLTEPEWDKNNVVGKLIPGTTIDKDPVVTVKSGSEDCYVFAQYTIPTDLGGALTAGKINSNWTLVNAAKNIYQYTGGQADANDVIKSNAKDAALEALFATVVVNTEWNGKDAQGNYFVDLLNDDNPSNDPNLNVPVKAYAVQAAYLTESNTAAENKAKAIEMAVSYFANN